MLPDKRPSDGPTAPRVLRHPLASWLVLLVVLVPALLLRLPIAGHDVEHYIGPDEGEIVENVLEMLKTSDWDHRHSGYPALNFYLMRVVFESSLHSSTPRLGPEDIPSIDRAYFYGIARRVTLWVSWLAAWIIAAVSLRYGSLFSALISASLVAYSPLVFRETQVVNPDLMLVFFASLSLWLTLRAVDVSTRGSFFLAGVGAALAASVKYTGGSLVAVLVVGWVLSTKRRPANLGIALVTLVAVFCVVSPFTVLNLSQTSMGLSRHLGYYGVAASNAGFELVRLSLWRGVGPVAFAAALASAVLVGSSYRRPVLIVWSLALAVLVVFFGFGRAFPRHALVLVPPLSLLAGWSVGYVFSRGSNFVRAGVVASVLSLSIVPQCLQATRLSRAARRASPAQRAHEWALSQIPTGSRILQDQYTPRFRGKAFDVYRFRVEDRVFPGQYDWVMFSGYPPGLETRRLRRVAHFETDDAMGAPIEIFQVPDRESLMGTTLRVSENEARLGAGQLRFFGDGWSSPESGAYATSRVSIARRAQMFFVLEDSEPISILDLELRVALATGGEPLAVRLLLNGEALGSIEVTSDAPTSHVVRAASLERGLHELTFVFDETRRMNRRRRTTAIRFYELSIRRLGEPQ